MADTWLALEGICAEPSSRPVLLGDTELLIGCSGTPALLMDDDPTKTLLMDDDPTETLLMNDDPTETILTDEDPTETLIFPIEDLGDPTESLIGKGACIDSNNPPPPSPGWMQTSLRVVPLQ